MGGNLSPLLRRELQNLDKDPDSRKAAMRALKSYVKGLDSSTIPIFLAQVSETKETGSLSGEFTVTLYEDLARVHGPKIVHLIESIMQSIVQTLASSVGSSPLQQACSNVVSAIARYGIDPTTPEDKKRHIIHSLCKPLSDSLSSTHECLTSGAALCLEALIHSDNWRFASDEMVNRVCQNVAAALEGKSQTNSHMDLVLALAKRNPLIVEAYARLLIQSGLRSLNTDGGELLAGNSQKRHAAIQMVNLLMQYLDPRSIFSEVELIIEEMEMCQFDKMADVQGAAFEALKTARRIALDKNSRCVKSPVSVTGSNFSRRDYVEEEFFSGGNGDHSPVSHDFQILDFFPGYEYVVESPISTNRPSRNLTYQRRSVNRKLWSRGSGGVDVSLKDGLFSQAGQGNAWLECSENEFSNGGGDFAGFMHMNPTHRISRSTKTSPLRSCTQVNADSSKIFATPRKLIHSLQDPDDAASDCSENQNRRFRSLSAGNIEWNPTYNSENGQNDFTDHVHCDCKENGSSNDDKQFQGGPESVSSTDDLPDADMKMPPEVVPEYSHDTETTRMGKPAPKGKYKLVCGLSLGLLAMATPLLWISSQEEGHYLVPT